MASALPEHVRLVRRAQRDIDKIPPAEQARIIEDLIRLANRTLPGEIKPIPSLPGKPLQADAGRFRILHAWDEDLLWVYAIFARPEQRRVFRGFRKKSGL